MLNKIFIMGRLARDPELRRTQTGTPVASFTLAVDRDFKDKTTGERATDWIDVVAWRTTAEFVSRYFTKGRMAVVEGRLQIRDWTDKDGNKRRSAEVVADNVYFGDSKREGDGGGYSQGSYSQGGYSQGGYNQGGYDAASAAPSGYGAPPADGDQFADLSDDDGTLPF
jgi:single-strand DNA-binding protein